MAELQTLMTGIVFGESPRWHDDRLWFSDWGAQELIAVDLEGGRAAHGQAGIGGDPHVRWRGWP